jgi:hypothetical protein
VCAPVGNKTAPRRQGWGVKKMSLFDVVDGCLS